MSAITELKFIDNMRKSRGSEPSPLDIKAILELADRIDALEKKSIPPVVGEPSKEEGEQMKDNVDQKAELTVELKLIRGRYDEDTLHITTFRKCECGNLIPFSWFYVDFMKGCTASRCAENLETLAHALRESRP